MIDSSLLIFKNNWKKCLMIFFSFTFIFVVFDILMGNVVVSVYSSKLFSLVYVIVFSSIILLLPKKLGIFIYTLLYFLLSFIMIAQVFHYQALGVFFGVTDLTNFSEGLTFISFVKGMVTTKLVIFIALIIATYVVTLICLLKTKKNIKNKYVYIFKMTYVILVVIIALLLHNKAVNSLGPKTKEVSLFYDIRSERNIYEGFVNRNACMQLTQIYEYTFRDAYLYIKKTLSSDNKAMHAEIKEYLNQNKKSNQRNDYTGLLKDQNLIYILMESIDSWLVTDEIMPTLSEMKKTGLNFENHYAPIFGGGRTFNTEFAANTGLYIPINGYNINNSVNNNFDISLANLFKEKGYTVNSIHAHFGYFYNRTKIHKTFGYENSYFLADDNPDIDFYVDTNLVKNNTTYKYIVPNDNFMTFIITYSGHGKYDETNYMCPVEVRKNEIDCIKYLAGITDDFIKLLVKRLEKDNLLDNTTLVLFTDHYAYGYNDIEYLKQQKQVQEPKDIEKVPFIIWNNNIGAKTIDKISDTADILPTVANLFGVNWNPNNYLGTDIFSKDAENFVYFNDYTYVSQTDENLSNKIAKKIDINDKILISDYFRYNK